MLQELEREEERRRSRPKDETTLMYYSGDDDDEDDSSVTSSTGGGGVGLDHGYRHASQRQHHHSQSARAKPGAKSSQSSAVLTTTTTDSGVHLYVTPPVVCWSPSDSRTDASAGGPHLRITPPSRRQSTASSVLDPGYFSFPPSRRQSSVSPPPSTLGLQHHEDPDLARLSVPGRRSSRHKVPLVSPCSPSNRSSSPPSSSDLSLSPAAHYQQRHPRRTSSQPSIDPGYFSTPASRRTSAVSPTSRRQSVVLSPTSCEVPTSPTRLIAYSPSRYYRPVSPTIEELQQFSTSSTQTSRRRQPDKGYHSTPSSRRASYLPGDHGMSSYSQPVTRRSSLAPSQPPMHSDDLLLLPHSTPSSRRPSQHSPSMLDVAPRDPPRTTLRLSPSLFADEHFLSPSSAEGGYHSTPITRRSSAISPTTSRPQHFSTPSSRRQSFLPPSSLHIPSDKSHLRRPSAPAILCKQETSKKKLLFPDSPEPEPGIQQHLFYPHPHKETTIPTVVVHQQPDQGGQQWVPEYLGIPTRHGPIIASPQPRRQRRQSEPFIEESPSFRLRTNSTHITSSPLSSASGTIPGIHRSSALQVRCRTQTTRPRLRSLSSVTEARTRTSRQSASSAAMLLDDANVYNIREVSSYFVFQIQNLYFKYIIF